MVSPLRWPLLLTLLLGGCASLEELPQPTAFETFQILERPLTPSKREQRLYRLLLAELALKKRLLPEALHHYLEVAKETRDPQLIRRASAIAMALRDFRALSDLLEIWLSVEPESIEARRRAVLVALQLGEWERALPHLRFLFERDRDLAERLLLSLTQEKRLPIALLHRLEERFPTFPEIFYCEALLQLEQGRRELVAEPLAKGLEAASRFGQRPLTFGALLDRLVEVGADHLLTRMGERFPDEPLLGLAKLRLLVNRGSMEEAEKLLRQILARWPQNPQALWTKAVFDLQRGRLQEAEKTLRKLLRYPAWRSRASLYLGHIASQRGRLREALSWYKRVEEGELLFEADQSRLLTLMRMGRFREAEELLDRLFFDYPHPSQQARLYLLKAQLYLQQQNRPAALSVLSEALRRFPDHPDLLYLRAMVADELERYELVLQDLQKLVQLRPEDPQALNALGYTLLDRFGKVAEAKPYLEKALKLRPDDAAIQDSYGWLLFKEGKPEEAIRYLQQAYRKSPDPEIGAHLAEVLLKLGRRHEAQQLWQEVKRQAQHPRLKLWVELFRQKLRAPP